MSRIKLKIPGFFWGSLDIYLNQSRPIFKLRLIEIDTNDLIVGRIFVGPEAEDRSLIGDVIIISFKFRNDFGPLQFPINLGMFAEIGEIEQRILAALHDREQQVMATIRYVGGAGILEENIEL
jgi:hypothetical protein